MTKVLIFENDDVFAGQLRAGLGAAGCTVQVFKEGTPGLKAAAKAQPDCIILTVELPRVNGFSICNKLKKDPKLSSVPLLLLSSKSTPETFEQHKKLKTRAEVYLHKPISLDDLLDQMRPLVKSLEEPEAPPPEPANEGFQIADESTSQVFDDEIVVLDDTSGEVDIQTFDSRDGMLDKALARHSDRLQTTEIQAVADAEAAPTGGSTPPALPFMPTYGLGDDEDDEGETQIANTSMMAEAASQAHGGDRISAYPGSRPPLPTNPPAAWQPDPSQQQQIQVEWASNKRALQHALRELSQLKRVAADAEGMRAQLAGLPGITAERDQLRDQLARAHQKLGSADATANEEDVLALRERLQARDKELVDIRDKLSAVERELIGVRDEVLAAERRFREEKAKVADLDGRLAEATKLADAATADKTLADKRAADFKEGARKIAEQLNQRSQQLRELEEQHKAAIEESTAAHKAALEEQEGKQRDELARVERQHQEQLERLKAEHDAALAAELENQAAAHAETLQAAEAKLQESRGEAETALREEMDAKLTERQAAMEGLEARLAEEKEAAAAALAKAKEEAEAELAQAQQDAEAELASAKEAAEAELAKAKEEAANETEASSARQKQLDDAKAALETAAKEHADAVAALEAEVEEVRSAAQQAGGEASTQLEEQRKQHDELVATLKKEHTEELEKAGYELREKLLEKEKTFESLKGQLDADLEEAQKEAAELSDKLSETSASSTTEVTRLTDELDATTAERDQLREELLELEEQVTQADGAHQDELKGVTEERDALQESVNELAKKVGDLEGDLRSTRDELQGEQKRLLKARGRWGEDRHALDKARAALETVAEQLALAAGREMEDGGGSVAPTPSLPPKSTPPKSTPPKSTPPKSVPPRPRSAPPRSAPPPPRRKKK